MFEVTSSKNLIKFSQNLGPSIKTLFKQNNHSFAVKTICNIGIYLVYIYRVVG